MDDKTRDLVVLNSAYGFVGCICILLFVGALFGKGYGRMVLLTLIPAYSLYYVVMYLHICRSYEDDTKRMSSFGLVGRGTFVGAIYHLSLWLSAVLFLFLAGVLYESLQGK